MLKRLFAVLFTTLLLSAALGVTASAASFDTAAQELSAIGMFQGTNNGFELDRSPTRAEAAIMLVRLYGAEAEAGSAYASGDLRHPFTDVPDYAAPHVAWLYSRGIANGTSPTTFSAAEPCTAQNYMTFLMRCLGYQDGKDFQYATVADFAQSKGLLDTSSLSGSFLRDDLVSLTYQALSCDLKDGSTYLLDSLVQTQAVDSAAAQPITGKIENYRALLTSCKAMDQGMDVSLSAKANMVMTVQGTAAGEPVEERQELPMDFTGRIQMILGQTPQMAMTMQGTSAGETMDSSTWLKDGWLYTQSAGESYKVNVADEMEQVLGSYQGILATSGEQLSTLPFLESITVSQSGQDTVYTLRLNDAFAGFMDGIVDLVMGAAQGDLLEGFDMDIQLDDCSYVYTLDASGQLKKVSASIKLKMDCGMNLEDVALRIGADMDMTMDMLVNALGSAVQISYPDFSGFVEQAM